MPYPPIRLAGVLLALLAVAACTSPPDSGLSGGSYQYQGGPTPSAGGSVNPATGLPGGH